MHTFLHELGHANDYLSQTIIGFSLGLTDAEVANNFVDMRKKELHQLPVGMAVQHLLKLHQSGWLGNYFEQNRVYYTRQGIGSINDLLKAQEIAYVNSPMEATAHDFAAELIRNNWDRLGVMVSN